MKNATALAFAFLLLAPASGVAEDLVGRDLSAPAAPAEDALPVELTGTLKKIHDTGAIKIAYREASFPFSSVEPGVAQPHGYAIDLCLGIVGEIVRELNGRAVRVEYVPARSDDRIEIVKSGRADLECGSTTSNSERQKLVAFSPITYVAGTKLLVKRGSGILSYHNLSGKTLVVTAGTTNEAAMKQLNEKYKLGINIVSAPDHNQSYDMLADGKADAFATDDVLLYGFVASKKAGRALEVVGDFITYEPYGIMFRRDDPLMAAAVTRAFSAMAKTKYLSASYRKWFLDRTPSGELLNLPMSVQLSEVFRGMGAEE